MVSAGIGSGDRVAIGGEHAAFERRAILARSPHQPYAAKMDRERELKIIRRAYGKQVTAAAGVGDPQVEAAFAAVAREDFLGPGPWHIVRWGGGYRATPDADPIYLYTDDVIGILPKRNLNNGQPSLHAALIAAAAPQPGEHVLHIGVGVGYYTAILAELVGATGRVTAIEYDAELAARATANLAQTPHVRVVHGDGTRIAFEPADVIYVNAGATRPADAWLDRLKEGGRLILPLTANAFPNRDVRRGAVFRIERHGPEFLARRISGVAIFPCEGGRDEAGERALGAAFDKGGAERVTRLYLRDDLPEDQCWLRAPGWCLAYR
jgi:protein-L-isoaspartate(D-aspartate) O-methyltransferase